MQEISPVTTFFVVATVLLFILLGIAILMVIDHKAKIPGQFAADPFTISGLRRDHPGIAFLTTTIGSGTSNVLPVQDASYFYDGYGISGEVGDEIQLENSQQRAIITRINYNDNRLTLDREISWADGQGVSLTYHGAAPDIGAYEYP